MYVPAALSAGSCAFYIHGSCMFLIVNSDISFKQRQQIDLCMVKFCVFFEVRTELLRVFLD
jgi:hypothetical protein